MQNKFPYGNPQEMEKKRALEFLALSAEEKYNALIKLIKLTYQLRQAKSKQLPK